MDMEDSELLRSDVDAGFIVLLSCAPVGITTLSVAMVGEI